MKTFHQYMLLFLAFAVIARCEAQAPFPDVDSAKIRAIHANQFVEYLSSSTIPGLLSQSKDPTSKLVVGRSPNSSHRLTPITVDGLPNRLQHLTANSAAVIEGTPERRVSFLCANGSFVCSDYTVRINTVYRANGLILQPGQVIIITRGGGSTLLGKHQVRAVDPEFELFHLDEPYVLYLAYVPEANTFKVTADRSFMLGSDGTVSSARKAGLPTAKDKSQQVPVSPFSMDIRSFRNSVMQAGQVYIREEK